MFKSSFMQNRCDRLVRNAIRIQLALYKGQGLPVGQSRFGGQPDVPEGFLWPRCNFQEEEQQNFDPMSFLMQFNLAELHSMDTEHELPASGLLSFFASLDPEIYCRDEYPEAGMMSRVFYFPGDPSSFKRQNFPDDLSDEFQAPQVPLLFESERSLPNSDEFLGGDWLKDGLQLDPPFKEVNAWDSGYIKQYGREVAKRGCRTSEEIYEAHEQEHKLLGWGDWIQSPAILDPGWQLLFQMDSIHEKNDRIFSDNEYELCLGDVGKFYFYINNNDLKLRQFNKTLFFFQCY